MIYNGRTLLLLARDGDDFTVFIDGEPWQTRTLDELIHSGGIGVWMLRATQELLNRRMTLLDALKITPEREPELREAARGPNWPPVYTP